MRTRNTKQWLAIFCCSTGLVYSGSAIADEGPGPAMEPTPDLFAAPADETAAGIAPAADEPAALPQGQTVNVGSFGEIDLHVKDLDLTKVLQLLSIQSQRNIIASRNVAGTISADLYDVGFYDALDAILSSNGFGYREKGQFIYVYTAQELAAIEQAERELTYEVVRLNYITAADASAFVSPLLSQQGSISVSGEVSAGMQPTISDAGANSFAHTDTLVIRDYQENVDEIMAVLTELDIRPKQVLVEATILQAKLSEANAFGVDFAIFSDLDVGGLTNPLQAVDSMITGTPDVIGPSAGAITSSAGNVAAGKSSIKIGYLGSDAAIFVRALDSVTDTTLLATPKILVLNRQRADLLVGRQLGYLSSTATETSTTQTVEFLDVGTQLTLRPFISDDNMVRLELRPEVSDGSTRTEGGFVIPDKETQTLTTNVIVASGQTVVLGGLFTEDTTIGRRQVPGLGEVPILGNAFKGQDDTVDRNEIIFLVKPTIMKDKRLYAMGEEAHGSIKTAVLGARKGLLPWSRTKLTTAQVRSALKHLEAGETDKALWSVNLALYLDPTMVKALELKEDITGEKFYYHQFSMLQDAIDNTIEAEMENALDDLEGAVEPPAPMQGEAGNPAATPAPDEPATASAPTDADASFAAELWGDEPAGAAGTPGAQADTDEAATGPAGVFEAMDIAPVTDPASGDGGDAESDATE